MSGVITAITVFAQILGHLDGLIRFLRDALRRAEVRREAQKTVVTDAQVRDAINLAKLSLEELNSKWNGD